MTLLVHVQQRADAQQAADKARRLGDAAALDIEAQVGGEEPVVHPQLVLLDPLVQGVDVHALVPQVGQRLHNETVAGGGAQRVHNVDLPVRELFPGNEGGAGSGVIGAGQPGGQAHMENVLSAFQNGGEQRQIFGNVYLRGAGFRSVGHGLIENGERHGLSQIIGIGLAVQGEMKANVLNITGNKLLVGQIGCGAAGQCVRRHGRILPIVELQPYRLYFQYTAGRRKSQSTAAGRELYKKRGVKSRE